MAETEQGQGVRIPLPSARVLTLAALACFCLDVLLTILQVGIRIPLISLGLAFWVASDVVA